MNFIIPHCISTEILITNEYTIYYMNIGAQTQQLREIINYYSRETTNILLYLCAWIPLYMLSETKGVLNGVIA